VRYGDCIGNKPVSLKLALKKPRKLLKGCLSFREGWKAAYKIKGVVKDVIHGC
jgi:hypothetical protein